MLTQSSLLQGLPNLHHGFTNLSVPKAEVEKQNTRTATAKQVHKADLVWVDKLEKQAREADAIATFQPNLPVGVYSADCTPILIAAVDPSTRNVYAVMAAHAGWRSTALGIARSGFQVFSQEVHRRLGRSAQYFAAVGPCISLESFEVGPDVIEAFPGCEKNGIARYLRMEGGRKKYLFDLPGENIRQLREAGGERINVESVGLCTLKLTSLFPSYRRDKGKDGRILSFLEFTR